MDDYLVKINLDRKYLDWFFSQTCKTNKHLYIFIYFYSAIITTNINISWISLKIYMYVLRKKVHILPKNKQLIIKQFEFETSHKNGNPQDQSLYAALI